MTLIFISAALNGMQRLREELITRRSPPTREALPRMEPCATATWGTYWSGGTSEYGLTQRAIGLPTDLLQYAAGEVGKRNAFGVHHHVRHTVIVVPLGELPPARDQGLGRGTHLATA
jgi:hypothetical protein